MEQDKRGLCPYDDKRYLLADLPNGTPNPNTHAYGHHELATEAHVEMDMPERSGTELVIEQRQPPPIHDAGAVPDPHQTTLLVVNQELRFKRKNTRVAKLLSKRNRRDSNGEEIGGEEFEQVPDGDENGELDGAQLRRAERAAAARPGAAIRMGDVIEQIIARQHLRMPESPPKRLPMLLPQPSPQRAGMSL